ncbi:hypothetical protein DER45DRAFT_637144 [Fusarium avenaceum]|nr:hypothetical protein DER45DRAFT_637144 [Fusarium avenaceum]
MRAPIILTSLIAGLGAAHTIIDPLNYDINNDPFHDELHNLTLAEYKDSGLVARQENRVGFIRASGIMTVAGYTYVRGAEELKQVWNSCSEWQGGEVRYGGDCIKSAAIILSTYSMVGVAAYTGPTAAVGLLTGILGLANTLAGNQGQGPSTKRAAIEPPPFQYGVSNISDSMIDAMNHAVAVAKQQKEVKADPKLRQACSENNGNLYQPGHRWMFGGSNGMKIQCKNGCGNGNWNGNDMATIIDRLAGTLMLHGDMNAQFTLYNNQNGRVYARCKMTFLTGYSDTCPEFITGQGCNF